MAHTLARPVLSAENERSITDHCAAQLLRGDHQGGQPA